MHGYFIIIQTKKKYGCHTYFVQLDNMIIWSPPDIIARAQMIKTRVVMEGFDFSGVGSGGAGGGGGGGSAPPPQ